MTLLLSLTAAATLNIRRMPADGNFLFPTGAKRLTNAGMRVSPPMYAMSLSTLDSSLKKRAGRRRSPCGCTAGLAVPANRCTDRTANALSFLGTSVPGWRVAQTE